MQDKLYIIPARRGEEPEQATKSNLPLQLTPLIDREHELATACSLLQRPEVRLLTLTGTGGVGKTRLAVQVATELLDDFADGACFVSLAPISDPDLVLPTLAQSLGLWEVGDRSPLERLQEYLHEQQLLLFLDNFEQVIGAAPLLVELLQGCHKIKMLVTSRAVLRVSGEHEFLIPPLAVPNLQQLPALEILSQYAAIQLFLQRAQAIKPDFQLTNENASSIAEICARLDGLPLAIELAAARIKLLPPQALLSRLDQRLQVLTGGPQDVPARQQTLRNTLAWSYDLLATEEQRLFRRLSVFVGGCTLEAAEAVSNKADELALDVMEGIASLIDKSLLQQSEQEGEEPRLTMLETIREYGRECLEALGEVEITHHAHAAYYLALAEEAEPRMTGSEMGSWLERLQQEHENLRTALTWLLEHNEQEAALLLSSALRRFWWMRGHVSEGRTELARALAESQGVEISVRAKALCAAGALAVTQGDFVQAETLSGESLALFRVLGDSQGYATSLTWLGYAAWQRSDFAVARSLLEEAVAIFRETDDQEGITLALVHLTATFLLQGEYDRARTLIEEALVISRESGDTWDIANALWALALVLTYQGDLTQAQVLLEESLTLARQEGYKETIAYSLYVLGTVALQQGDPATARALLEESLALFKEVGDWQNIAQSLFGLAGVSFMQGDYAATHALLEESLTLFKAVGDKWFIALCLVGFATLAGAQGAWTRVARLSGAAEALCQAINGVLPPAVRATQEFTIAAARAQLGDEAFTAAWAEGRTMTPEQALASQGPVTMATTAPVGLSSVPHTPKAPIYPDSLTAREVEVLRHVSQGLTNVQVAQQLVISRRTVNWHLTSIYSKLGVSSRSAATRYAIKHTLV